MVIVIIPVIILVVVVVILMYYSVPETVAPNRRDIMSTTKHAGIRHYAQKLVKSNEFVLSLGETWPRQVQLSATCLDLPSLLRKILDQAIMTTGYAEKEELAKTAKQ